MAVYRHGWDHKYPRFQLQRRHAGGYADRAFFIAIKRDGAGVFLIREAFTGSEPLTVTPNQWQLLTIDYTIGSTSMTVGLDANSALITGLTGAGAGAIMTQAVHLAIRGSTAIGFLDYPTPEPATLALLGLGGLMLLRRKR